MLLEFFPIFLLYTTLGAILPAFPIDETRYLSVAWELFSRHNPILLTLNFQPYFDKPPLLFWGISALWHIFPVSLFTARLVNILSSTIILYLLYRLAIEMGAEQKKALSLAYLAGLTLGYLAFSILTMTDMLLVLWTVLAIYIINSHQNNKMPPPVSLLTVVFSAGLLTKGPVYFLHVLPYPILLNLHKLDREKFKALGKILLAVLFSSLISGTWLFLASHYAGKDMFHVLTHQTIGRVTHPYAHRNSVIYLIITFWAFLLPHSLIPSCLRGLYTSLREKQLIPIYGYIIFPILFFLLSPTRQPQYLLPELPLIVMLMYWHKTKLSPSHLKKISILSIPLLLLLAFIFSPVITRYSLQDKKETICKIIRKNKKVAVYGKYQGEFNFLCRVKGPMKVITQENVCKKWLTEHPQSPVIWTGKAPVPNLKNTEVNIIARWPYRHKRWIVVFVKKIQKAS